MTFLIGTPHTHNAGYLQNNKDLIIAKQEEFHIKTCTHCQAVIRMELWKEDGAWCSKCSAPVCGDGECGKYFEHYGCRPYIKYIEEIVGGDQRLQQFRRLAGLDAPPENYQPSIYVGVQK